MTRLAKAILFCFILACTAFICASAEESPEALQVAQVLYDDSYQKLERDHAEDVNALSGRYVELLNGVKSHFQTLGDLDAVLRVDAEQQAARTGGELPPLRETDPPELALRRGQYERGIASLDVDFEQKVTRLRNVFLGHLKILQSKLTRENRIDEAVAVQNEVKALEAALAVPEVVPLPQVTEENSFRLMWGMPQRARQALLMTEGLQKKPLLLLDRDTQLTREGLICKGGRVELEGMGTLLAEAIQASGGWSMMVEFTPESLRQYGPARILTYSKGARDRNFTLGQDGDRLILSLRTPANAPDERGPELDLGRLSDREVTKVVVSYREGEMICFRDGEEIPPGDMRGDFSNWEPMHLLIGNEWRENWAWRGVVHSFVISNEPLSAEEAAALSTR